MPAHPRLGQDALLGAKTAEEETQVALYFEEGFVTGTVRKDGLLHVTFNYVIEGSHQSEEQLLKLDGDKLIIISYLTPRSAPARGSFRVPSSQ